MGEKKKSGKTEALRAKKFIHWKKSLVTVCTIGLYNHQDKKNYQNQQKQLTVTRTKWEEIKKMNKKQNFKRVVGTVCEK